MSGAGGAGMGLKTRRAPRSGPAWSVMLGEQGNADRDRIDCFQKSLGLVWVAGGADWKKPWAGRRGADAAGGLRQVGLAAASGRGGNSAGRELARPMRVNPVSHWTQWSCDGQRKSKCEEVATPGVETMKVVEVVCGKGWQETAAPQGMNWRKMEERV
ncbi:hypothetical protein VTJ49DRAFT_4812 [Mycothermus thermophilus]|uniref:Uncharacterized protein n=1 Tax=Humicola insolens TaxID=85995 RepID=A0ABR3V4G0_HUMIN